MLDMLIQGGRVVTPAGVGNWDVGIMGEQIVAVAFPGILPGEAKQVLDARGKIVVPGGIETHAHAVANVQPGARTLAMDENTGRIYLPTARTGAAPAGGGAAAILPQTFTLLVVGP